jgi:hypothetical protein
MPPPTFKEIAMTADEACASGEFKTYDECLAEIMALRDDPNYGEWASRRQPNKGPKVTPEMFEMSDEFLDAWADKVDSLFTKRAAAPEGK